MRLRAVVLWTMLLTTAAVLTPGTAAGEGLPATIGLDIGTSGVTDGSGHRYVTVRSGADTVVARTAVGTGKIERSVTVRGAVTTPAVAYDRTAGGLSADDNTLVLIRPRRVFPRISTTFAVLDAPTLRLRKWIHLRGDFSFDAISPSGNLIYLVSYLSRTDPTKYEVRTYDLRSERLLPQAIVDPEEPDEQMGGHPLTRAMSPDGRWAYTLYRGSGGHEPFIHALDTVGRKAACIDLPQLLRRDFGQKPITGFGLRLSETGQELRVTAERKHLPALDLLAVDTRTFAVSTLDADGATGSGAGANDGRMSTLVVLALIAVAALTLALLVRRRSRRRGAQLRSAASN